MIGGIIESYFQWFHHLFLNIFRIDMDKKIKENPGIKSRLVKLSIYVLADFIAILVFILFCVIVILLFYLVMYYI